MAGGVLVRVEEPVIPAGGDARVRRPDVGGVVRVGGCHILVRGGRGQVLDGRRSRHAVEHAHQLAAGDGCGAVAAGDGVFFAAEVAVADRPHAGGGTHGAEEVGDAFDVAGVILGLLCLDDELQVHCGFCSVGGRLCAHRGGDGYGTENECESEGESAACASGGCECSGDNRKHGLSLCNCGWEPAGRNRFLGRPRGRQWSE